MCPNNWSHHRYLYTTPYPTPRPLQDREPLWPVFPKQAMRAAARRGLYNSGIDYTVQCTRAVLDYGATRALAAPLAARLTRDLRAAVQGPAAKLAWHRRAPAVLGTALFSEATLFAADALVASCVEAVGAFRWYRGPARRRAARLAKRAALHALRGGAALAAVACGNALGSVAPAGRALAMFACAQAASMLTNAYMSALLERLTPEPKPAPGDDAARDDDAVSGSLAGPHPADAVAPQEGQGGVLRQGVGQAVGGLLARLGAEAVVSDDDGADDGADGGEAVAEPPVPAPQEGSRPLAPAGK